MQEGKLRELQAQQKNLTNLQIELGKLDSKLKSKEKLSQEDAKFLSNLGWLSALGATITVLVVSI